MEVRRKKDDTLQHHGVKGQKWGIRRYQNPDGSLTAAGKLRYKGAVWKKNLIYNQLGEDVTLKQTDRKDRSKDFQSLSMPKGESVNHITPLEFKELKKGQDLYISADKEDQDTYKAYLSMMLRVKGFKKISEVKFELKQDLKSPSNTEQEKIFNTVYESNKKIFDSEIENYYKTKKSRPEGTYDQFIKSLDKQGTKSKKLFYDAMKKAGYNAVLDSHDINYSWMQASRPLIVMDAVNTLGNMKVDEVDNKAIYESLKRLGVFKNGS